MGVTRAEDGKHSTASSDPRPRLRRRFFASVVLIGLLLGLLIGRLTPPEPVQLLRAEAIAEGLRLWFDHEPELHAERIDGAIGLLFQAQGSARHGELEVQDARIRWRLQHTEKGLLLHFVATRPLMADWQGKAVADGWRLDVAVAPLR